MLAKSKRLFRGSKISCSHQTLIEAAKPIVREAKGIEVVTKVVIAELVKVGPGKHRIKISDVPAGLKVVIRGGILQQVLYLYTTERRTVQARIERVWSEATT